MLAMWNLLRQATRWLLNLPYERLEIGQMVKRLGPGLAAMEDVIRARLSPADAQALAEREARFAGGGFPRSLARRVALLDELFPALDIVETAARRRTGVERVAAVSFRLGEAFEMDWLRRHIESLEVAGEWHAMSRAILRDELITHHNRLVERVLAEHGRKKDPVATWIAAHGARAADVSTMLARMKNQAEMDYATLSVAVRFLGQLAEDKSHEG
jgi:glutamate dehydrogenase